MMSLFQLMLLFQPMSPFSWCRYFSWCRHFRDVAISADVAVFVMSLFQLMSPFSWCRYFSWCRRSIALNRNSLTLQAENLHLVVPLSILKCRNCTCSAIHRHFSCSAKPMVHQTKWSIDQSKSSQVNQIMQEIHFSPVFFSFLYL